MNYKNNKLNILKERNHQNFFDLIKYLLDYIYKEFSSISKDIITELHLRFFKYNQHPQKKILGYWDFNQRLARLGDFITFLENLEILREKFNINKNHNNIDICFIDDQTHYNAKQSKFLKSYYFKDNFRRLPSIIPHLNNLFFFNSNKEFENYFIENQQKYIRWPPTVSGSRASDFRTIETFYSKFKKIPKLNVPDEILDLVYMFYEKEIYPSLPIIINFRKNNRSLRRNSDINMYKKIFQNYKNNLKYKFIIICNKEEIIEEFRDFKNVYFSKDYFNTIEYDLGLIKSSFLSFFPDSGMSVFGYFSNTPFIQFGHMNHQKEKSYIPLNKKTYNFLLDYQKVFSEDEKYDLWISEFEKMTLYLNEKGINNNQQNKPTQKNYESYF